MSDLFHTRFPGLVCTATWQNSGDNPVVDEDPMVSMVSMVSYVLLIEIYEDPLFFFRFVVGSIATLSAQLSPAS